MPFPARVETERLLLRRWTERDRGAWLGVWGDPGVWASLRPGLRPDPRHALARFEHHLRHWDEHGFGLWAAEESASGVVAGWVGASHPDFVPELAHEVEIGWALRRPFHGRGLATEGARAAVAAAVAELAPERLVSLVAPDHRRSIAVAERIGMREQGRVRHTDGGFDLCVYAVSAGEAGGAAAVPGAG
jgi:RimJ/RimL family protein N-acetyltransferase